MRSIQLNSIANSPSGLKMKSLDEKGMLSLVLLLQLIVIILEIVIVLGG